jgi:hypothetical protein
METTMQDLPKSISAELYVVAVKYSWRSNFDVRVFDYVPQNTGDTIYSVLCTTNLSIDLPGKDVANVAIQLLGKEKERILQEAESKTQMIEKSIKSLLTNSEE